MKKILPILSAILSLIPAILIGIIVSVGAGILCYFLSLIAGVLGFRIGKFLNDFVGERMIFTEGGFSNLLFAKLDAMYGPQIAGFLLGLIIPAVFLFVICPIKDNSSENSMKDQPGISKKAEKYINPLIEKDSQYFSEFGTVTSKRIKTENDSIIVEWDIQNDDFFQKQENLINDNIVELYYDEVIKPGDIDFNLDIKTLIPMDYYNTIGYKDYDNCITEYSKNKAVLDFLRYGRSINVPYDEDIVKWCKYFRLNSNYRSYDKDGNPIYEVCEKSDYSHWFFDNGKTGTEEDYNKLKNKYKYLIWNKYIADKETYDYLMKNGIFPGTEKNYISYHALNNINKISSITSDKYNHNQIIKNIVNSYNNDFKSFIENNWSDYPDTMEIHKRYEEKYSSINFLEYLDILLKEEAWHCLYLTELYCFEESKEAFYQTNRIEDYLESQKSLLNKTYYESEEYKSRLSLYKQLVKYDKSKIIAKTEYTLVGNSKNREGYRLSKDIVYQLEVMAEGSWNTVDIPIEMDDGEIILHHPRWDLLKYKVYGE